jgi:hypothetical protein
MKLDITDEDYRIIMSCLQRRQAIPDDTYTMRDRLNLSIKLRDQREINKEIEMEGEKP